MLSEPPDKEPGVSHPFPVALTRSASPTRGGEEPEII